MNNAGIMATPLATTEEGYEIQVSLLYLRSLVPATIEHQYLRSWFGSGG